MHYRRLGRTQLEVSCLGLGGMGFVLPDAEDRPSGIIRTALGAGINLVDTARGYGRSEEILGKVLSEVGTTCYVATKTFLRSEAGVQRELDQSLRQLRREQIDIYQVHHVQYESELKQVLGPSGALEAIHRARDRGKVRFVGVSCHRAEMALKCIETGFFDTIQIPFNPMEASAFELVCKAARDLDLGILGMKPFGGGSLQSVDPCLRFALSGKLDSVLVGCSSIEQVRLDAHIAKRWSPLSPHEFQGLHEEIKHLPDHFCRRCRYCERTCPNEIRPAEIFRCEDHLPMNATFARIEYSRMARDVTNCGACGKCEEVCPFDLPVRQMLQKAHRRLKRGRIEDAAVRLLRRAGLYDVVRKAYFALRGAMPKR